MTTMSNPERLEYRHPGVRMHFWSGGMPKIGGLQPILHWHDNFEMVLVLDGELAMLVNGDKIRLMEGDFLFVNSGQIHKLCQSENKTGRYSMVIVHPEVLGCDTGMVFNAVEPLLKRKWLAQVVLKSGHTGKIPELFARLRESETLEEIPAVVESVGLVFELWAEMLRLFNKAGVLSNDATSPLVERASDAEFEAVRAMVTFIHGHYGDKLTLKDIAAAGGVGRSRCCEIFARHIGQSPIAFLNSHRLDVAARLLRQTAAPIADLAFTCGFAQQSYFTQQFKETYGKTPQMWRKKKED